MALWDRVEGEALDLLGALNKRREVKGLPPLTQEQADAAQAEEDARIAALREAAKDKPPVSQDEAAKLVAAWWKERGK